MIRRPLVSIVIPVYNGANYLRMAIDSALNQTYDNCEVIVVNDGSDDDGATENIALSYGDRIRYYYKINGGVSTALNLGIQKMKGEYFSWLSHDDIFCPNKTELQVELINGRNNVVVYGNCDVIDCNSKHVWTKKEQIIPINEFRFYLMTSHPVCGCTTLIPVEIFSTVGLFDESLNTVQDYDMWYRISKSFAFVLLPQVVTRYRVHIEQGTIARKAECIEEWSQFYRKAFDENLDDWENGIGFSKISYCIQAAVFSERNSCPLVSRHAFRVASSLLRSHWSAIEPKDIYWFLFYFLFKIHRFIFHQ